MHNYLSSSSRTKWISRFWQNFKFRVDSLAPVIIMAKIKKTKHTRITINNGLNSKYPLSKIVAIVKIVILTTDYFTTGLVTGVKDWLVPLSRMLSKCIRPLGRALRGFKLGGDAVQITRAFSLDKHSVENQKQRNPSTKIRISRKFDICAFFSE